MPRPRVLGALALLLLLGVAAGQETEAPTTTAGAGAGAGAAEEDAEPITIVFPSSVNEDGDVVDANGVVIWSASGEGGLTGTFTPADTGAAPAAPAEPEQDTAEGDGQGGQEGDGQGGEDQGGDQGGAVVVPVGGGDGPSDTEPEVTEVATTTTPPATQAQTGPQAEGTQPPSQTEPGQTTQAAAAPPAAQEPEGEVAEEEEEEDDDDDAAAGAFGSKDKDAPLSDARVPEDGNVISRYPLSVDTEGDRFSENMDRCIRDLVSKETGTDDDDWSLVSARESDKDGVFDIEYDAEVSSDREEEVNEKVREYIDSGNLDNDIDEQCEEDADVDTAGDATRVRSSADDFDGSTTKRILGGVLGTIGALGLLGLLGAGAVAAARRGKGGTSISSDEDAYSRSVFPTSTADDDVEAGHVNVQDPALVSPRAEVPRDPTPPPVAVNTDADAGTTSYRDEHGNFAMDRDTPSVRPGSGDNHPHDYLIGEGPVTAETPHPPADYVVRDSATSGATGSTELYSSLRDSTEMPSAEAHVPMSERLADARDSVTGAVTDQYRNLRSDD